MSKDYSPNVVASSFIKQYYEMMTKSPENLHKFYNENSYFLHSDLTHPSGVSATGPEPIRAAINALNLKYTKVDLTNGYVDAQKSANNGVFVLVVGTLAPPDAPDKPFVQTFLLSNQASSAYYVSNSVFRLLVPGGEQGADSVLVQLTPAVTAPVPTQVATAAAVSSPVAVPEPVHAPTPVPAASSPVHQHQHHEEGSATSAGDASATHIEAVEALLLEEKEKPEPEAPAAAAPVPAEELPAAPTPTATPAPATVPVSAAPAAPVDPNRKLNYSDIVRKANSDAAPAPAPAAVSRPHHHVVPTAPAPAAAPKPTTTAASASAGSNQSSFSVYIKQLPDAATQAELANLFGQFGTVVGVDQAAGRSFAFIKFDSAAAVQAAVAGAAGGKLTLHGQALRVEERNSTRSAGTSSSGAGGTGTGSGAGRGNRDRADGRREGGDHRRGEGDRDRRPADRERGDRREGAGAGRSSGVRSAGSKPAAAGTKAN